ncbi:unnamed protein product [Microthlaspi erraticum]|uniref:TTF-type domain-containing protein n=1 Tax=Microthlaspi erraticum TaxID=1685480 RepID=A0A6D2JQ20_9BRAS|nr:unnamed protein product [Microthlaspi erraticum]CAA7017746.1 unnamed protein product [Microthlaspi erraticum]CAA7041872.1 unnamed protein product [Microthlaspi erraticum]CAA7060088.1 unnamed protein product [Microthlaspi erraticum]
MDRFVKRTAPDPINLNDFPEDPGERKGILEYHPNQRDEVRRTYWLRGPCQPRGHPFKQRSIGNTLRRFNLQWFDEFHDWLEYSVKKEKAYCLCCYLFRDNNDNKGGNAAFVTEGFHNWNKYETLAAHGRLINSFHHKAKKKCEDLVRQGQSIAHAFQKQTDVMKNQYRIRLNASVDSSRLLLRQGLPFRGHDETEDSSNQGNFLAVLKYTAQQNEAVDKVVLKNAPGNNQMVSHPIQKDIVHCFSEEVISSIIQEIDHDVFALLVDESADSSEKEQMAIVFRFVDKHGIVKERFVGLIHVKDTCSSTLKSGIDSLLAKYRLSLKKVRGQGYDGAGNMRGEFNGLRALISRESSCAYYVHCFAHQLQLVVVAVAKNHLEVGNFFDMVSLLVNVAGASCKRKDKIRDSQREINEEGISSGEIKTGKGLNQESSLQRPGATRWGSHYKTLLRLVDLFASVVKVLRYVQDEGIDNTKKRQANGILKYIHSFDFVVYLHLMLHILGLTENLSMALQKKNQDIANAVSLVESTKRQLQKLRDDGWDSFVKKVSDFCKKHDTEILNMEDEYIDPRRPRMRTNFTNLRHFQVDCFYYVLDIQLLEFNDRFNEVNSELLICISALNPIDLFCQYDKIKLMRLAEFYPEDFSRVECISLEHQLDIYIDNVREDERFADLKNLGDLARVLVETKKHLSHYLVYRLLKLALVLPVATATVERCFSGMKIVKTKLRNRMGDQFLSDSLICYIEKELYDDVTNEQVTRRFQAMSDRRMHL